MEEVRKLIDSKLTEEEQFALYAFEHYRAVKGLSVDELLEIERKYHIFQQLKDNYFLYHIERSENFVEEIDEVRVEK